MKMTIAARRSVTELAAASFDFRKLLKARPAAAILQATGISMDPAIRIAVIEEGLDWEFVMVDSTAIEADLPDALDVRLTVENLAYALFRDQPDCRVEAEASPRTFIRDRLGLELAPEARITLHPEATEALVLVIPNKEVRETLDEEMLDRVAGGANPACNSDMVDLPKR